MTGTPHHSADGSGASRINQAGRDLYAGAESRSPVPNLVSIAPPHGRLDHEMDGKEFTALLHRHALLGHVDLVSEWTALLGPGHDELVLAMARTSFQVAELCRYSGRDAMAFELSSYALAARKRVVVCKAVTLLGVHRDLGGDSGRDP